MTLSDAQRRIKKSKQSERDLGHWLLEHDGPDTRLRGLTTSTGRVGHLTHLQFDVMSNRYAAENKQVKVPAKLWGWWKQIVTIATAQGKDALLRIEPTNTRVDGTKDRGPDLHILTAERHAELLAKEKYADEQGYESISAVQNAGRVSEMAKRKAARPKGAT
jgi:hypothetical protein